MRPNQPSDFSLRHLTTNKADQRHLTTQAIVSQLSPCVLLLLLSLGEFECMVPAGVLRRATSVRLAPMKRHSLALTLATRDWTLPLASTELAALVLSFPRLLGKMHPYGQGVGKMYRPDESKWGANDEDKGDGKQSSRVWPSRLKESRAKTNCGNIVIKTQPSSRCS